MSDKTESEIMDAQCRTASPPLEERVKWLEQKVRRMEKDIQLLINHRHDQSGIVCVDVKEVMPH